MESYYLKEGRGVFRAGAIKKECPYKEGSNEAKEWNKGFTEAKQFPGRGFDTRGERLGNSAFSNGQARANEEIKNKMMNAGFKPHRAQCPTCDGYFTKEKEEQTECPTCKGKK